MESASIDADFFGLRQLTQTSAPLGPNHLLLFKYRSSFAKAIPVTSCGEASGQVAVLIRCLADCLIAGVADVLTVSDDCSIAIEV